MAKQQLPRLYGGIHYERPAWVDKTQQAKEVRIKLGVKRPVVDTNNAYSAHVLIDSAHFITGSFRYENYYNHSGGMIAVSPGDVLVPCIWCQRVVVIHGNAEWAQELKDFEVEYGLFNKTLNMCLGGPRTYKITESWRQFYDVLGLDQDALVADIMANTLQRHTTDVNDGNSAVNDTLLLLDDNDW